MVIASAPASSPLRVTHVITGLGAGGAETALYRLVSATRGDLLHDVVSLTGPGHFGPRLLAEGVPVTCLGMRPATPSPLALVRLVRHLRALRPDVVQGWMYHANLLAGLAAGAAGRVPVVWGIHHARLLDRSTRRSTRWTNALCARLSTRLPARITCCAEAAARAHVGMGYDAGRVVVIPNGFDAGSLAREPAAGARVRAELAIPPAALVVGTVSRYHPDKDPDTLLRAAGQVVRADPRVVFVLAGRGLESANAALAARVEALGLRDRVRLLGSRGDVPALLSAMDVFALSSRSEAFPVVLGEAMLCELPCVATDCGDAQEIVGPWGRIVPPEDPGALAAGLRALLDASGRARAALGAGARERVRARYDLGRIARLYVELYAEVGRRSRRADEAARARGVLAVEERA